MPTPTGDPASLLTADDLKRAKAHSMSPFVEAVWYTSRRKGGDVTVPLYSDWVVAQPDQETARKSNGVYTKGGVVFSLPLPTPAGIGEPKVRDVMTTWRAGANRRYVVTSVTPVPQCPDPFYKLFAVSPQLAKDLDETLALLRPASGPDAGGVRGSPTYATVWQGDGRLQPDDMAVDPDAAGRLGTRTRHTAVLAGPPRAAAGDVIRDEAGALYEVTGQQDIDQLGLFTAVLCERLT